MNTENLLDNLYFDDDADISIIQQKTVAVIGYGNQAKAQALNLHDSGVNTIVGLREGSTSIQRAKDDGLKVDLIEDAVKKSDVIALLVPDQIMSEMYNSSVHNNLSPGNMLIFAHGYNIHYGLINPPKDIDIAMAAPSGAGKVVRSEYIAGKGVPNLIAVKQDNSGNAFNTILSYSKAIGGTRKVAFKSSFKEETETDLFGEQSILTGGLPKLLQTSFKVLLERGYSPVVAWFVCYYELKTIVDMFHERGFEYLNNSISDTAEYGGITRGNMIMDEDIEKKMHQALDDIQSGDFHKEWMEEASNEYPKLSRLRQNEKDLLIEKVGKILLDKIYPNE